MMASKPMVPVMPPEGAPDPSPEPVVTVHERTAVMRSSYGPLFPGRCRCRQAEQKEKQDQNVFFHTGCLRW